VKISIVKTNGRIYYGVLFTNGNNIISKGKFGNVLKIGGCYATGIILGSSRLHSLSFYQWRIYKGDWGDMSPGPEGPGAH
jgi:hypothetical protein